MGREAPGSASGRRSDDTIERVIVSTIRVIELAIPLISPFRNAATTLVDRRVVLIEVHDDGGAVGWGEAAPFPGATEDDIDTVWASLTAGEVDSFSPSAHAAYDEGCNDAAARTAGLPLWRRLGVVEKQPITASLAVGIEGDVQETLAAVAAAIDAGYRAVKLKIAPERISLVEAVRRAFPDLAFGVDGNGSFRPDEAEQLVTLDEWCLLYLEQPFAAGALAASSALRRRIELPVVLDEDIVSSSSAVAVVEAGAADVVTVKPGRLGVDGALAVFDVVATEADVRVKISGLIETGIGRGHALALAMSDGVVFSDLAPAQAFLENDIVDRPWMIQDGMIGARSELGIGVEPDPVMLARYLVRETVVDLSGDR